MSERHKRVDVGTEKFGTICVCAVRYALGRQTYMPSIVCGYILPLIPHICSKSLCCMERDIRYQAGGYGDDCDKVVWMRLLSELQAEIEKRGEERWM